MTTVIAHYVDKPPFKADYISGLLNIHFCGINFLIANSAYFIQLNFQVETIAEKTTGYVFNDRKDGTYICLVFDSTCNASHFG